ncbi:hypothetical protein G7Y89_g10128 [Cudoniella acicularis]|uniref:Ubiquitin-like protease family profile domain-containing protein n=1 Tax=Cudoniella acicularis TaxID=354080 RepID=A0A8H4VZ15_9HELO|nr:hypothetical protein G7Y89_g10128 [Cudoniella acicularis]
MGSIYSTLSRFGSWLSSWVAPESYTNIPATNDDVTNTHVVFPQSLAENSQPLKRPKIGDWEEPHREQRGEPRKAPRKEQRDGGEDHASNSSPSSPSSPPTISRPLDTISTASIAQHPHRPNSLGKNQVRIDMGGRNSSDLDLAQRMEKLLNQPGEQNEDKQFSPSGYMQEKRARLAKERKIREKKEAILAARAQRLTRRFPSQALVEPLSPAWEDKVNRILHMGNHEQIITTSIGGTELRIKDFATLLGNRSWLNDEIINTYIEWIVDAANKAAIADAKELGERSSTVPKFIAHNSFFWNNLKKKGPESTAGLMRRKKAPGDKLLEVDSVFVPICRGNHWTIGTVRPVAKTIEYFDSMGGGSQDFVREMRGWLKFQLGNSYIEEEWTVPRTGCARQNNGYDCGVFVCTNAFCVTMGLDTWCYKERDMTQQRRNIAALLINRGFVGDFSWDKVGR